jgi:hypothetical protein
MEQKRVTEAQRLKGITQETLAEKDRIERLRKAIEVNVVSSIRKIYETEYRKTLESAARDGESSVVLDIKSDFGLEEPAIRGARAEAVEKNLRIFLVEEGLTVNDHSGSSHGDQPGLLVSWN